MPYVRHSRLQMKNKITKERRLALLMGSSLAIDDSVAPIPEGVRDTNLDTINGIISNLGLNSFGWASRAKPIVLKNPARIKITEALDEIKSPRPQEADLLLFYYFGHGFIGSNGNLTLAFSDADLASDRCTLNRLVAEFVDYHFKKLIFIIDCCHAGLGAPAVKIESKGASHFIIAGTGEGWSFFDKFSGGKFTQALKMALEVNSTALIVPQLEAVTFKSWFAASREFMEESQQPEAHGELGDIVLLLKETDPPPSINHSAPPKSIYTKMFHILRLLGSNSMNASDLHDSIRKQKLPSFKLIRYEGNRRIDTYVSEEKLNDYLVLTSQLKFTSAQDGKWSLTIEGRQAIASEGAQYNSRIVSAVFDWLPEYLDRKTLKELLFDLISRAVIPNASNLEKRLVYRGLPVVPRNQLRIALRLLGFAGVLQRAKSDTFFPGFRVS